MATITIKGELAQEYLRKYPDKNKLTLARILYKENPEVYGTIEDARSQIRRWTGALGKDHRQAISTKEFYRKTDNHNPFNFPEPEPVRQTTQYYFPFQSANKVLIMADLQIPFHALEAIEPAINYGLQKNVNSVLLLGDVCDMFGISPFVKDPREGFLADEVESVIHFLTELRKIFPGCEIFWKKGNHEYRFDRYMMIKAPELFGIPNFDFANLFKLNEPHLNIKLIGDKQIIKAGKLNLMHAHELGRTMFNSVIVSPAKWLYDKTTANSACADFHRTSNYNKGNIDHDFIGTWTIGCMCNKSPEFLPVNQWNWGFAITEFENNGIFHFDNKTIDKGKVL